MRLQSHPYGPLLAALQASGRADGRLDPFAPAGCPFGASGALGGSGRRDPRRCVTGITAAGLPQKSLQSSERAGRLQEI
jgi:hypothetical protein